MSLWEKVMSWLPFIKPHRCGIGLEIDVGKQREEKEVEERLRKANVVSDHISQQLAKASDQQVKRSEDIKVVLNSVMLRTGTVVNTAEEALFILRQAGSHR